MAIAKPQLDLVYKRFLKFVTEEGFYKFFKVQPNKVLQIMNMKKSGAQWSLITIKGLNDFDKAYKVVDISKIIRVWAKQIHQGKWDAEEVPAIMTPVILSLVVLSIYVQIYRDKITKEEYADIFKHIEENLKYTYRMSLTKLDKIDPVAKSFDKTIQKMSAYLRTRSTRYKTYIKGLLQFSQEHADIRKM